MTLSFNKNDRAFVPDLNNAALMLRRAVRAGCDVLESGPPDMDTNIQSGQVIFDTTIIDVAPQAVTHAASDPSLDRYDLVVVDNTGVGSVITGTPATEPQTPTYNPLTYVVLARVLVQDGVVAIPQADIIDIRVLSTGLIAGAGGIGRHITTFTGQTTLNINHGLGDDAPVVQVYDNLGEQITPDTIDIVDADNVDVTFSVSTTGTVIIHGGESAFTGTTAFYQMSFVAQTTVNVPHNLGIEPVHVTCYDGAGVQIEPLSVTIVDLDNVTVVFSASTTGRIAVSGGTTDVNVLGVKRYSESFTGETTGYIVNHNLNTTSPSVTVYDSTGAVIIPATITATTPNVVTIDFSLSTTGIVEVQGGTQSTSPGAGTADLLPVITNSFDIGSGTFMWKDGYFAGKLTVLGGVDPTYLQLAPQGADPAINNSLWVDSSDSKLKFRDNVGSSEEVVTTSSVTGSIPIGAVTSWLKSHTGTPATLPDNFVECNGQTISDVDSPYNGIAIPNLNGNQQFLRPSSTSGSTGGSDTHTLTIAEMPAHTHSYNQTVPSGGIVGGSNSVNSAGTTGSTGGGGAHNNLPSYYEVVMIMRIK
jgi:hypothetical protein